MPEPVDEIFSEATEQLLVSDEVERKRAEVISWVKQGNKLSKTIKQLDKILTERHRQSLRRVDERT